MMRFLLIIAIAAGFTAYQFRSTDTDSHLKPTANEYVQQNLNHDGEALIRRAFETQFSNLQVEASGKVIKILEDDTNPPRHQRFILKLENGISLLVAHNIDLAKRVENLNTGDVVSFNGEYEWNKKGGVLHWTHHDPQGQHEAGWLRHNGKIYQ
jgi:uncharacterized protein DUF3465